MVGNPFTMVSFLYIVLLFIVYFSKPRIKSDETMLYKNILITCLIGSCISFGTYYFMVHLDSYPVFNYIFAHGYLLFILCYLYFMTQYVLLLAFENFQFKKNNYNYKKILFITLTILFVIFSIISILMPMEYHNESNKVYSYGTAVDFIYVISRVCLVCWIIILLSRIKKIQLKKCIPMIAYVVLGSIASIVNGQHPELQLMTSMLVFVAILMYFTIENPDVKMIEQLNEAKDAADKANNAKSEFLSSMSHEIRTPLNAIVGFSNGLVENDKLDSESKDDVKNIIMASDALLELVNGILDISKIEAGKLEIIDTYYNFHKMFDELVLLTKARLGEKPLDFRYYFDKSIPEYLYGDVTRVKQVILNLLTNSVKYTKEGFVEFRVNSIIKGDVIRLIASVEDSGIGIKKDSIDKLFGKFERLGVEKDTTVEGTGLGLAITKKLVEMMGGKIVVQSVYGKGSIFTISIDQKIVTGSELEKLKSEENAKEETLNIDASGKKVLVVDDNNLNLKVAQRLLSAYKCDIELVSSGFECVEKVVSGEKYDLILLDDMMPKMSGTETLGKLKEVNSFNIPVVALTANAISGMKEEYLKKGFNDYLSKPIEKNELSRVIKKYLC